MSAVVIDLTLDDSPPRKRQALAPAHQNAGNANKGNEPKKSKAVKPKYTGPMHHDGELEVDDDAWPDHDERCHGTIDSNSMRREFPENFIWSCCNTRGGETEGAGGGQDIDEMYATSECPSSDDEDAEMFHSGTLEVDEDGLFWADWDEDVAGDIDTKSNRREYPEGFKWTCCGGDGSAEGCCDS
eukprot:CAMPEP_0114117398 /NCGR_PEP_ID=MMETSP0043_2-20121206/5012_1 /TAXON_ID=464988 /ORGANISM="Hemiselmis andersenii, Strain CCMP644" /LENGTH=184 /DNA_ID=CAMNT_0001209787 /DNA_START=31 /DNA_END=586 /DNA_ORIENTATION=+